MADRSNRDVMDCLELCFVTRRCGNCPVTGLGLEIGSQVVDAAAATLESYDLNPSAVVRDHIPGVKQRISESDPSMHPVLWDPTASVVWRTAVQACMPNYDELEQLIIRREFNG